MKAWIAILSAQFRTILQYRAAAMAGVVTQIVWGLIRMMIFEAFYRSSTVTQPMDVSEVVTYIWLGQAMLTLMPWNTDPVIRDMVRRGTVAYELLKPVDTYSLWFFRAMATRSAPATMRALPIFILGIAFWGMGIPDSVEAGLAWVLATIGAILLSAAISSILNISLLWTISADGITRIVPAMVMFFSGMIIPLPLLPDWAQTFVQLLPFAGIADLPFRLYMGHIPPEGVFGVLAHQLIWTGILVIVGRIMMARGVRQMVVQGG